MKYETRSKHGNRKIGKRDGILEACCCRVVECYGEEGDLRRATFYIPFHRSQNKLAGVTFSSSKVARVVCACLSYSHRPTKIRSIGTKSNRVKDDFTSSVLCRYRVLAADTLDKELTLLPNKLEERRRADSYPPRIACVPIRRN